MGHDISIIKKKTKDPNYPDEYVHEYHNCFPVVGCGTYACDLVDGELVPRTLQESIYITYNNSGMYSLAMENIGHPQKCFGRWLNDSKTNKVLPILELLFDELITNPKIYEPLQPKINPETNTRWGGYDDLCNKIYALIFACRKYPKATIRDSY